MAMDIRRSNSRACRSWLEKVLLSLEGAGVLEATRERNPPHYHVALFPKQYASYVDRRLADAAETGTAVAVAYRVRSGDSLWSIARKHGTSITELRTVNELRGSRIYAGQVLTVPAGR
jgi:nucleoid-associated protein YgaU